MPDTSQFRTDRTYRGRWTITFNNPPINMFVPATIVELRALMTELEADPSVKVVVFQSANPDFFVAHLDVAKAAERPEALGLWRDFVLRLSSSPVVSIAKIRGRTRGIGNEFVLACDMRFASRQSAVFGQPERLASCFCEEEGENSLFPEAKERTIADCRDKMEIPIQRL